MKDVIDRSDPPDSSDPNARYRPRADGKVYCCATIGWVTPAEAFDHVWEWSNEMADRESEEREARTAGIVSNPVREVGRG